MTANLFQIAGCMLVFTGLFMLSPWALLVGVGVLIFVFGVMLESSGRNADGLAEHPTSTTT